MRDPKERLRDVLEAIASIERYAARDRQVFESDELIQNWFCRVIFRLSVKQHRRFPRTARSSAGHPMDRDHRYASYPSKKTYKHKLGIVVVDTVRW